MALPSPARAAQLIQGFPLWGIALATLLPWVPVFTLEMMWRYRHYQWLVLFEVVLISQIGHFIEHLVQMYQIHVLGLRGPAAGGIFSQLNVEWVHFLFNTYLLPMMLAFAWQMRAAYDEWLAKVSPRLRPQDLATATQRLETVRVPLGEVIVREGEVAPSAPSGRGSTSARSGCWPASRGWPRCGRAPRPNFSRSTGRPSAG